MSIMLKINQLQAFNEVMLTGSISEAARHLHRTQSSISATIAGIEDELDMQLFERRGGRLHPIPEARYLHNECVEILRRLETVSDNMHRMKSLQTGELHIASMPGPSVFFLPALLAQNLSARRNVRSNLVSRSSEGVYRLVAGQRYDVGLADYIPELSSETPLIDVEVFEFNCVCAIRDDHELAAREVINPADLQMHPLATLGEELSVHSEVQNAFARQGLTPNICHMTQYFLSLLNYVEQGLACAIVDPISAKSYQDYTEGSTSLSFKRFEPDVKFRTAMLIPKHRTRSKIAEHFTAVLRKALYEAAE